MAKRNEDPKEIMTVGDNLPAEIMDLIGGESSGFEDIQEYITLPFIKIIQGQTSEEIQEIVGNAGSVGAIPGPIPIAKKGKTFEVIPVFFWNSFHTWSDLKDKESPMFLDSSLDGNSELAKKAKSKDPEQRSETYGERDQFTMLHCHHFNFASIIFAEEIQGLAATITFCKGEWSRGRRWMNQMYNTFKGSKRVPLYLQRWEFGTSLRDRGPDKKWWGFDMVPAEEKIVSDVELANMLIGQHHELRKAHIERRLAVQVDDETGDSDGSEVNIDL